MFPSVFLNYVVIDNKKKKQPHICGSDNESQILCIELDKNNVTASEDYVSVADLYQLASKHVEQGASVRVNDYSAFKNSLNFQLQAAKAAVIAESGEYDVVAASEHRWVIWRFVIEN